ncbi:MAG: hypothetical protein IJ217_05800 [Clostridia bacterium]|nr:hypothetical protein [Clostridia bacterium]
MPIVSFWSTVESTQTATTSTIVAAACAMALKNNYKILLTQTHYQNMDLETSFFNMDKMSSKGSLDIADTGVDALDRLLRSNKLSPENIANYAKPIMKGKLELLYGSFKNDTDSYDRVLETIPMMVEQASRFYDLVLVDLSRGYNTAEINQILQQSDLIVLTMSQKMQSLKKIFKDVDTLKILQEKTVVAAIGKYDRFSKYTNKNIARNFNYKKPIYTIPYNTQFFDACNEGTALNFFIQNINADVATDRNGYFIDESRKLADAIVSALDTKLGQR